MKNQLHQSIFEDEYILNLINVLLVKYVFVHARQIYPLWIGDLKIYIKKKQLLNCSIDFRVCIFCGNCVEYCPTNCLLGQGGRRVGQIGGEIFSTYVYRSEEER
jgi:ferredoxin